MTRFSGPRLLQDLVTTLVTNFGAERVEQALSKAIAKPQNSTKSGKAAKSTNSATIDVTQPNILNELDELLTTDPDKHRLVLGFYEALKSRKTLPDPQDIRHFAQLVGIKHISGKSRKDMLSPLVRFLICQSISDLQAQIELATTVSERQRQQGFSILTNKLLGS